MKRKQRIKNLLLTHFKDYDLEIIDNSQLHIGHNNIDGTNETHIKIILIKKNNINKINKLEIHRKINELVSNEFNLGLHSLEISIN